MTTMLQPPGTTTNVAAVATLGFAALAIAATITTAGGARSGDDRPWWDRTTQLELGAFRIRAPAQPEVIDTVRQDIGVSLNVMHGALATIMPPLRQRFEVPLEALIFDSRDDFEWIVGRELGAARVEASAVFVAISDIPGGLPRSAVGRLAGDAVLALCLDGAPRHRVHEAMLHEGFRQFAYTRFGRDLPPWAMEGLAQRMADGQFDRRRIRLPGPDARRLAALRVAERDGRLVGLGELFTFDRAVWVREIGRSDARHGLLRDQAWLVVLWMMDSGPDTPPALRAAFAEYLTLINEGYVAAEAHRQTLGRFGSDVLDDAFRRFIHAARPDPGATAVERLEFLAEGMLALASDGIRPTTLADLRDALRDIDFQYTVVLPDTRRVTFTADDDALFELPKRVTDDEAEPRFELTPPPRRQRSSRERRLNDTNPEPHWIVTRDLGSRNWQVRWQRDMETNTFSYSLVLE